MNNPKKLTNFNVENQLLELTDTFSLKIRGIQPSISSENKEISTSSKNENIQNLISEINSKGLPFKEIPQKIVNHDFIKYPEALMLQYKIALENIAFNQKIISDKFCTFHLDNAKLERSYSKFMSIINSYSMSDEEKNNFVKFYHNQTNTESIKNLFNIINSDIKLLKDYSDIIIPHKNLLNTEYEKDLDMLKSSSFFNILLKRLIDSKSHLFNITINSKPITNKEGWVRVSQYLEINKRIKSNVQEWNEKSSDIGLSSIYDLDNDINKNKRNIALFSELLNSYKEIEEMIFNFMELSLSPFDNVEDVGNYIEAYSNIINCRGRVLDNQKELKSMVFFTNNHLNNWFTSIENSDLESINNILNKKIAEEYVFKSIKSTYIKAHTEINS